VPEDVLGAEDEGGKESQEREKETEENSKELVPAIDVKRLQREDREINRYIKYLEEKELPDDAGDAKAIVAEAAHMWLDEEGRLVRTWWPQREGVRANTRQQVVVPRCLRDDLMRAAHDDMLGGHLGRERTYLRLREKYWWPYQYKEVEEWVRTCEACQAKKDPRIPKAGQLEPIPVSQVFERMGMDLVGPLPKTAKGNKYLLVMVDYLSKWAEAFPLPKDNAEAVAEKFVEEVICRFGAPKILLTDRGKQFTGKLMTEVNRLLGIRKDTTTAYHPQTDGLVERFNHTLIDMIAKFVAGHQKDWDIYIPYVLFAYRTSPQGSTGDSPFYLMMGRTPMAPEDIAMGAKGDAEKMPEVLKRLGEARELAKKNIEWAQAKQREQYNQQREAQEFGIGQLVLVSVPAVKKGRVRKLTSKWRGPYIVLGRRGGNNYFVRAKDNEKDTQVIHVERMKPYFSPKEPEGELEVEEIVDWRFDAEGKKEFLVKWRAMTDRYNEWIKERDVHAPEAMRKFLRRIEKGKEKEQVSVDAPEEDKGIRISDKMNMEEEAMKGEDALGLGGGRKKERKDEGEKKRRETKKVPAEDGSRLASNRRKNSKKNNFEENEEKKVGKVPEKEFGREEQEVTLTGEAMEEIQRRYEEEKAEWERKTMKGRKAKRTRHLRKKNPHLEDEMEAKGEGM